MIICLEHTNTWRVCRYECSVDEHTVCMFEDRCENNSLFFLSFIVSPIA